jgi:hypothetical protein
VAWYRRAVLGSGSFVEQLDCDPVRRISPSASASTSSACSAVFAAKSVLKHGTVPGKLSEMPYHDST